MDRYCYYIGVDMCLIRFVSGLIEIEGIDFNLEIIGCLNLFFLKKKGERKERRRLPPLCLGWTLQKQRCTQVRATISGGREKNFKGWPKD